jgi:hypothetical protein
MSKPRLRCISWMASFLPPLRRRHRLRISPQAFLPHSRLLLTFPPKTTPLARKFNCAVMGQTEEAYDQKTPYRRANHCGTERRPSRGQCSGPVPEARHLRCHVLSVSDAWTSGLTAYLSASLFVRHPLRHPMSHLNDPAQSTQQPLRLMPC